MTDEEILAKVKSAVVNLDLLAINGRMDKADGIDMRQGWSNLCKEMGLDEFRIHSAYKVAYENGWQES